MPAAYVSLRQHTSAYVSLRQNTSANVSIRQRTSAYVSLPDGDGHNVHIRDVAFEKDVGTHSEHAFFRSEQPPCNDATLDT